MVFLFVAGTESNSLSLDERAGKSALTGEAAQEADSSVKQAQVAAKGEAGSAKSAVSEADELAVATGATVNKGSTKATLVKLRGKKHIVSYAWNPSDIISKQLYNSAGSREFVFLPESQKVRAGEEFVVNSDYIAGQKLYTHDSDNKVNGFYYFEGWSETGTVKMPDSDFEIVGKWSFKPIQEETPATPSHNVEYSWTGAPLKSSVGTLVDESNDELEVLLPGTFSVEEGKSFEVDLTWKAGAKVYYSHVDEKTDTKTLQRVWIFDGWSLSGSQAMGSSDIKITGTWHSEIITHNVFYEWENAPAEGTVLYDEKGAEYIVKLPEAEKKQAGLSVEVEDDKYYTQKDTQGNVVGVWKFYSWSPKGLAVHMDDYGKPYFIIGNKDVVMQGVWSFRSV